MPSPERTIVDRLEDLAAHVPAGARVLLVTTPGRRLVERARAALPGRDLRVFDRARVHVPRDVVTEASAAAAEHRPEVILTLGGGAATGLGKVLRRELPEARLVSAATTYAGSEMTGIWGITEGEKKETGRSPEVRPAVVVHDPSLVESLPRDVAVASLINALAHPVSALSAGIDDGGRRRAALRAIERLAFSVRQMVHHGGQEDVRRDALAAAASAGEVLDEQAMGAHHKVAHALGGRHQLPHASLHAVLLPHTLGGLREEQPGLFREIVAAARAPDLAGFLHDALARIGAPRSLKELGLSLDEALAPAEEAGYPAAALRDAWLGARPSTTARAERWGDVPVVVDGDPTRAERLVVALHGRGASAARAAAQVREAIGHRADVAVLAPQAEADAWYAPSYRAPSTELSGPLDAALERVRSVVNEAGARWPHLRPVLFGFSQGACLALEVVARELLEVEALFAVAGARPSGASDWPASLQGTPVYLSLAERDAWVDLADVEATARSLEGAGAEVTLVTRPGTRHAMTDRDRLEMRRRLGEPEAARGYGGHHQGEALPGAVPFEQNSPRRSPYGLYPEQLSGTGFVAPRHENLRTWFYRVRPSAQHAPFSPIDHPTLTADFDPTPLVNLEAWDAPALDEGPRDFVDGLVTLGGAGHPSLRRGYAIHLYAADQDMTERAFADADGDLIIVPQEGRIAALTELGSLEAGPGQVLLIPRGLRFAVLLLDGRARGYVGEVYARHFTLPERGLVGANGLADERHFVGPTPFYEDRLAVGYRVATKVGGRLFEATQDYAPWDVAGWHGSYLPFVYDTSLFAAVSNTRVDHGDPSVYTLLSSSLDETGAHGLDLIVFPARWDPTEHTFRPPYFHRNVTTEINGIVKDPTAGPPFAPGMLFLTPSMTAHGIRARGVDRHLARSDEVADKPSRTSSDALWFQFESALPFCPSPWARSAAERRADWPFVWGEYGSHFAPPSSHPGDRDD